MIETCQQVPGPHEQSLAEIAPGVAALRGFISQQIQALSTAEKPQQHWQLLCESIHYGQSVYAQELPNLTQELRERWHSAREFPSKLAQTREPSYAQRQLNVEFQQGNNIWLNDFGMILADIDYEQFAEHVRAKAANNWMAAHVHVEQALMAAARIDEFSYYDKVVVTDRELLELWCESPRQKYNPRLEPIAAANDFLVHWVFNPESARPDNPLAGRKYFQDDFQMNPPRIGLDGKKSSCPASDVQIAYYTLGRAFGLGVQMELVEVLLPEFYRDNPSNRARPRSHD